jgi:clathrin heavy chain
MIYLENEDFEALSDSIKSYDSFESLSLAGELETHKLLECRRIAALLYRKNKKYQKSIEISKKDELYKDAMETVAESKDPALAEDLLRHIMNMQDKELFAAMLYTCYELVKPDVALEIAWRSNLTEYVMPYFIQFVKDLSTRIDTVQKSTDDIKKKDEKKAEEQMNRPLDVGMDLMFPGMHMGMGGPAAIMPAPGSMPGGLGSQFMTAQPQNLQSAFGQLGGAQRMQTNFSGNYTQF